MPARSHVAASFLLLFVGLAGWFVLHASGTPPLADEGIHTAQVRSFAEGDRTLHPDLTTLPGYHAIVATLARGLGTSSLDAQRAVSTALGLLSVLVFWLLARALRLEELTRRTGHYLFQPLLFPFFFLVYTDATSLLCLLMCAFLTVRGRLLSAGLAGLLSVLVRQPNIVWVAFVLVWAYVRQQGWRWRADDVAAHLRRHLALVTIFPLFAAFWVLNDGVAVGDRSLHTPGVYAGNVWFFFLACLVALAPLHLANARQVLRSAAEPRIAAALLIGLGVYLLTFVSPHPYNAMPGYLRNGLLMACADSEVLRGLVFVPIAYTALSLRHIALGTSADYAIYPFTLIALLPMPLIEQRYALFPLVWIILTRRRGSERLERISLVYEVVAALLVLRGFARDSFFL